MKNIFVYDKRRIIVFCDTLATVSGDLMKAIEYRCPSAIESLKKLAKEKDFQIGDVYEIKNYVFYVWKKTYRHKATFESLKGLSGFLKEHEEESFKTIPTNVLWKRHNVVFYETCDWNVKEEMEIL